MVEAAEVAVGAMVATLAPKVDKATVAPKVATAMAVKWDEALPKSISASHKYRTISLTESLIISSF